MRDIDYSQVIENESELVFYKKNTKRILKFLESIDSASFQEIISHVEGGDRRTLRLLDEMIESRLIKLESGRFSVENNLRTYTDLACPCCQGKIIDTNSTKYKEILKVIEGVNNRRPKPTFVFDQRPITPSSSVNRAFYAAWRNDLTNKDIALIGDDDLTSLAIGLLGLNNRITVFEIDKRLIKFLKEESKKLNLVINFVDKNILDGIPEKHKRAYDVFFVDPTPTKEPFTIFVNAGIDLLRESDGSTGYLSFYSSCIGKNLDLQDVLTQMRFLITDSIPFYVDYQPIFHTFRQSDLELMEKFQVKNLDKAFFEYLIRVEWTDKTKKLNIKTTVGEIIGRATKRALIDESKDPALSLKDSDYDYLKATAEEIIKSENQIIKN